jgi:hypothetical protein
MSFQRRKVSNICPLSVSHPMSRAKFETPLASKRAPLPLCKLSVGKRDRLRYTQHYFYKKKVIEYVYEMGTGTIVVIEQETGEKNQSDRKRDLWYW